MPQVVTFHAEFQLILLIESEDLQSTAT